MLMITLIVLLLAIPLTSCAIVLVSSAVPAAKVSSEEGYMASVPEISAFQGVGGMQYIHTLVTRPFLYTSGFLVYAVTLSYSSASVYTMGVGVETLMNNHPMEGAILLVSAYLAFM